MLGETPDQAHDNYRRLMLEPVAPEEAILFERGNRLEPRVRGDSEFIQSLPRNMRVHRSTCSLEQIIDTVSLTLAVDRDEILSRSRRRRLAMARALITWYATERGVA